MESTPFSYASAFAIVILVWFLLGYARRQLIPAVKRAPKSRSLIGLLIIVCSIAGGVWLRKFGF